MASSPVFLTSTYSPVPSSRGLAMTSVIVSATSPGTTMGSTVQFTRPGVAPHGEEVHEAATSSASGVRRSADTPFPGSNGWL